MKEKGDYSHMKKHDLYAATKEGLKEAFDLFLGDDILSPSFQEKVAWINYSVTYLLIVLISTLTFGWGGQHLEQFQSPWALTFLLLWLAAWFFVFAWQTPLKQWFIRSSKQIKTLFRD